MKDLLEPPYDKYYIIIFDEQTKASVNPYILKDVIEDLTREKLKFIAGNNRESFTGEVQSENQASEFQKLEKSGEISLQYIHAKFYKGFLYTFMNTISKT